MGQEAGLLQAEDEEVIPLRNVQGKILGAEELVELGDPAKSEPVYIDSGRGVTTVPRTVHLSRSEGDLVVRTVESIVDFAKNYPIEFTSYCPVARWQETLTQVGTWGAEIKRQVEAGAEKISVPAEAVLRLVDLEKCVSASRDARLSSAQWAFTLSAGGTVANVLFGIPWVAIPTYLLGLGFLFGAPLIARYSATPEEPYAPSLGCRKAYSLSGCASPDETEEERKMIKLVERVILSPKQGVRKHWWGTVDCVPGGGEAATCLSKGRLRVRVEGWVGDVVTPAPGWAFADDCDEKPLNVIGVWETPGEPRRNAFGAVPSKSRHEVTYFVEYVGPYTGGSVRRAGPFGCPYDTRDHAIDDGGIKSRGNDGDYVLFDTDGNPVEIEEEAGVSG